MALRTGTVGPQIRANNEEPEVARQINAMLASAGVIGTGDFLVSQHAGTINRSVDVALGFAFAAGGSSVPAQGNYHLFNDAVTNLAIAAADPTNPRIDRVIVQVQDNYVDASGNNQPRWVVVAGTPAPSPALPSLAGYPSSLEIAQVAVAAGATTISNANITDVRVRSRPGGLGVLGYSDIAATHPSSYPTSVNGGSLTVTATGRRLRFTSHCSVTLTVATDTVAIQLLEDGTAVGQVQRNPQTTQQGAFDLTCIRRPAAGSHTYALYIARPVGTGNVLVDTPSYDPSWFMIEDIGA